MAERGPCDLLLTDVMMPEMTGDELARVQAVALLSTGRIPTSARGTH